MGSVVSKRFSHKDPAIDAEFRQLYLHMERLNRATRSMDMRELAKAVGPHLPADVLLNIERYFDGRREAQHIHLKGDKDGPLMRLTKLAGGTQDIIVTNVGAALTSGGTWSSPSSKNMKRRFRRVPHAEILSKLRRLRIQEWEYRQCPDGRRVSPTAEDFHELFGLGNSPERISSLDVASVALVAIQSLARRVERLERTLERHKKKVKR